MPNNTFTIMVSKSPFDSRNAEQALAFCKGAIEAGFTISQVFFYQSGVHNASPLLMPNNDEVNMYQQWVELHHTFNVPLNVCVSAGARRGIISTELLGANNENSFVKSGDTQLLFNLTEPFSAVGLSAYFEALNSANSISIQL